MQKPIVRRGASGWKRTTAAAWLVVAILGLVLVPALAAAQERGRVRIQGRDGRTEGVAPTPGSVLSLDPREEMRRFVQNIRTFARQYRREFFIIPQNGIDLLIKSDEADENNVSPARTYMRSIDGIIQEAMFFGVPEFDKPTDNDRREKLLSLADVARANGLGVFVIDYGTSAATIAESRRLNSARKFMSIVAPARGLELNRLPTYIDRPEGENPKSIISMRDVRNFAYLRDSSAFGRQDQFALALHDKNYDLVVVDVFHRTGEPLTKQAVETLKYKKIGARRLVLAYLNIGTAASYRYYWRPHWTEGSPLWINAPYPGDPDRYYVEYWAPEWQQVITGDTDSYVYGVIAQGFDGVILDGLESFRFFEGRTEVSEATP